ncbi:MAG TPA: alpha/beta fold hydrolase [Blastocatellia bacterium]|jgi:pimeloyl-ACP methyl ester carboxylesterase|nr:alpha/beta fold hydrolase [Blastocatellia bacterium]
MIISKSKRVTLKRILWAFIPAVLVFFVGVGTLDFYLIHRLTHPPRTQLYSTPRDFQIILQKPMWFDEKWKNSDSTESVGWFLSRGKPAPAVILSHAYGSNRSEFLTLAFEIWKAGYHVLVYDMRGHGENTVKWTGLGTYEKDDLLSAIKYLKEKKTDAGQPLLDGRVGLYGVEVGGYISLVASSQDPAVKAVAIDSVYPDVAHFINYRMKSMVGADSPMVNRLIDAPVTGRLTELAMQMYLMRREDSAPALESVAAASGRRFLFITAKDTGAYEAMTRDLHSSTKDPKELVELAQSRLDRLYDKASSEYDSRVVAFFQQAMPLTPDRPGKK